jgi:hypothetical protein
MILLILSLFFQLSSSRFAIIAPKNVSIAEKTDITNFLDDKYNKLENTWNLKLNNKITIVIHSTTYEFMRATNAPMFISGIFINNKIHLQPINLLKKKKILYSTLSHELAHAVLNEYSKKGLPVWLNEAFALYFSNEIENLKKKRTLKFKRFSDFDKLLKNKKEDLNTIYYYLALTMQFFINTYSQDKISTLLKTFEKEYPDKTISTALNEPIEKIESSWRTYLLKY